VNYDHKIVQEIVRRFKDKGFAKGPLNRFGYIRETESAVVVSREEGEDTPIPLAKIAVAVEAVRTDSSVYSDGPSRLREFGITHINSPIWAMLQLMTLKELKR